MPITLTSEARTIPANRPTNLVLKSVHWEMINLIFEHSDDIRLIIVEIWPIFLQTKFDLIQLIITDNRSQILVSTILFFQFRDIF